MRALASRSLRRALAAALLLALGWASPSSVAADRTVSAAEIVIVSDEIAKRLIEVRHAAAAPVKQRGRTWAPETKSTPKKESTPAATPAESPGKSAGWGPRP